MFTTINEANEWITQRKNTGRGFAAFCETMNALNNPQNDFPSIHIAGTNGKGSTVTFIKDCLMEAGYKVGTFTSPHMVVHQDRICINGEWIRDDDFLRLLNQQLKQIEENRLNMFEIDMLLACLYFKEENVDIAIFEVGLGGRLDSTNVLSNPIISVITTIGLDHMELLGNTEELIATQKAGIIKSHVPCVIGKVKPSVEEVIRTIANEQQSPIVAMKEYEVLTSSTFVVDGVHYELFNGAKYQMHNATLALTVLDYLKSELGYKMSTQNTVDGMMKSKWAGRFELIQTQPTLILDGAHNEAGIEALLDSLDGLPKPWVFVFSALKDKQVQSMLTKIHDVADKVIVTEFDFYRVEKAKNLHLWDDVECFENYVDALNQGLSDATKTGSCIVCGSLYFISEVRNYLIKQRR